MTESTNQLAHTPMTDEDRTQSMEQANQRPQSTGVFSPAETEGVVFHDGDRRHAEIKLAQSQTADHEAGVFFRNDSGEDLGTEIDVVVIGVQATRTLWGAGSFDRDRTPLCQSFNGHTASLTVGDGVEAQYPGASCVGCPEYTERPWKDKSIDGWCSPGYVVALMDADTNEGYLMRLSGTTAKLARYFGSRGVFRQARIRLSSTPEVSNVGSWSALKAKTVGKLDEADVFMAANMAGDFDLAHDDADDAVTAAPDETLPWNQSSDGTQPTDSEATQPPLEASSEASSGEVQENPW